MAKVVKILGPGCPKCQKLVHNAEQAVAEMGLECEVEKVSDIMEITSYGVMMTPALVVDGEVKTVGKVLSPAEIKAMLA